MAISSRTRWRIFERDEWTCRYCGRMAPNVELAVDHVDPQALGGSDDWDNLVTACVQCNSSKGTRRLHQPRPTESMRRIQRGYNLIWLSAQYYPKNQAINADDVLDLLADSEGLLVHDVVIRTKHWLGVGGHLTADTECEHVLNLLRLARDERMELLA